MKSPVYFIATEPQGNFITSLYFQGELIQSIVLSLSSPELWLSPNPFTLNNVSDQLDTPDAIYIIFRGPPAGYTILFIFERHKVLLQYSIVINTPQIFQDDDLIPFCPISSEATTLTQLNIWVTSNIQDDWILDIVPDLLDDREMRPWVRLESVTGINEQQFMNTLRDECFSLTTFGELRETELSILMPDDRHWGRRHHGVDVANGRSVAVARGVKVGVGVRDGSAVMVAIMVSKLKGFLLVRYGWINRIIWFHSSNCKRPSSLISFCALWWKIDHISYPSK